MSKHYQLGQDFVQVCAVGKSFRKTVLTQLPLKQGALYLSTLIAVIKSLKWPSLVLLEASLSLPLCSTST